MLVDVVCFLKNFRFVCLLFFWGGTSVQSISVQSRDRLGRRGDMRDDSAEILLHFVLFFPPAGEASEDLRTCYFQNVTVCANLAGYGEVEEPYHCVTSPVLSAGMPIKFLRRWCLM